MDTELRELIEYFKNELTFGGVFSENDVNNLQNTLDVTFPEDYRAFLKEYGAISGPFCNILGATKEAIHPSNIVFAKQLLKPFYSNLPDKYIPLESINQNRIVFMDLTQSNQSPVLEYNFINPNKPISRVVSNDFESYLRRRLYDEKNLRIGSEVLNAHVVEFEKDHSSASTDQLKIPRVHEWRPYRLCIQDVFLGLTVFKHNRIQNIHEVDVFLTASIPEYEFDSGVKGLTLAILSDAFRSGGSMKIRFSKNVECGIVPMELQELAKRLNVNLQKANEGVILPGESEQLYLALSDPNQKITKTLKNAQLRISPLLLGFAINSGIWDHSELLYLIQTAEYPERILVGELDPEDRLLYMQDLFAGQNALLAGQFDRRLRYRRHSNSEGEYHIESDEKLLEMTCIQDSNAISWKSDQEIIEIDIGSVKVLPGEKQWKEQKSTRDSTAKEKEQSYQIPPGKELIVLLRARKRYSPHDLRSDLAEASKLKDRFPKADVFVMVTRDIEKTNKCDIEEVLKQEQSEIGVIMQSDFCTQLDDEVNKRLKSTRGLRAT